MMREGKGARRYNTPVVLTYSDWVEDEFGHASAADPIDMATVYVSISQMSATKTMMTFQQADVVGVDIELREPNVAFNGIRWNGHHIYFSQPEELERGRILRIRGYYQVDNPKAL